MSELITYKEGKLLKATLKKACDGASELKVITGFFYFSAVKALYEALAANPTVKMRVIVGTDIEFVAGRVVECVFGRGQRS